MTDDERERLAHSVENMMGYSGGKPVNGRKIAARLRADGERIKALEAERQWQPIKTAPTDGSKFLAYEQGADARHYECFWQDDFPKWGGWQTIWDNEPEPTHWMPLPAPPVSGEERNDGQRK